MTMSRESPIEAMRLLAPAQVADLLAVSQCTVRRLCRSGDLMSYRVGGLLRIRATAVERYLLASVNRGGNEAETARAEGARTALAARRRPPVEARG